MAERTSHPACPHPVRTAVQHAVAKLVSFRPARVAGEPDMADARNLADDLLAIAAIIDPVVAAMGEYAQSTIGLTHRHVDDCFRHQLRQALEGNATFVIEDAMRRRAESRHADSGEATAAFRRA